MSRFSTLALAALLTLSVGQAAVSVAASPSSLPGATGHKIVKPGTPRVSGFKARNTAKHPPTCTAGNNGDSTCITYYCDASGVCVENGAYCVSGTTGLRIPC